MLDLDASRHLRWFYRIARFRVTLGFVVAGPAFWLARPTWVSIGLGGLVALIGESMRVWAAGHLEKGSEITRSGPYRLTRHPLYCGSLVVSVGFSIAAADMFVAALVVGYVFVTALVAIYMEEATLRDKFGDEYDRYVGGILPAVDRRFSARRVRVNGEYKALVGFFVALIILGLKAF